MEKPFPLVVATSLYAKFRKTASAKAAFHSASVSPVNRTSSVLVSPQVLQVKVFTPGASCVAAAVTAPSSHSHSCEHEASDRQRVKSRQNTTKTDKRFFITKLLCFLFSVNYIISHKHKYFNNIFLIFHITKSGRSTNLYLYRFLLSYAVFFLSFATSARKSFVKKYAA